MNNLILYNDTNEAFKYKLTLEGANITNTFTRLCLEFDDGFNAYFKGKIDEAGNCVVKLSSLENFSGNGTARIEVVAENSFFEIHSMPFTIKKRIKVKMDEKDSNFISKVNESKEIIIKLDKIEEVEEKKQPIATINESENKKEETEIKKDEKKVEEPKVSEHIESSMKTFDAFTTKKIHE